MSNMKSLKFILLIGFLFSFCGCEPRMSKTKQRQLIAEAFVTAKIVSNPEHDEQYFVKTDLGIWLVSFDGDGKMQFTQIF